MGKVTMPRAAGHVTRDTSQADMDAELPEGTALITTTKAEAYADARVRGALEEAAKICWEMQSAPEFGKDDKDRWLAIAESRIRSMIKE